MGGTFGPMQTQQCGVHALLLGLMLIATPLKSAAHLIIIASFTLGMGAMEIYIARGQGACARSQLRRRRNRLRSQRLPMAHAARPIPYAAEHQWHRMAVEALVALSDGRSCAYSNVCGDGLDRAGFNFSAGHVYLGDFHAHIDCDAADSRARQACPAGAAASAFALADINQDYRLDWSEAEHAMEMIEGQLPKHCLLRSSSAECFDRAASRGDAIDRLKYHGAYVDCLVAGVSDECLGGKVCRD